MQNHNQKKKKKTVVVSEKNFLLPRPTGMGRMSRSMVFMNDSIRSPLEDLLVLMHPIHSRTVDYSYDQKRLKLFNKLFENDSVDRYVDCGSCCLTSKPFAIGDKFLQCSESSQHVFHYDTIKNFEINKGLSVQRMTCFCTVCRGNGFERSELIPKVFTYTPEPSVDGFREENIRLYEMCESERSGDDLDQYDLKMIMDNLSVSRVEAARLLRKANKTNKDLLDRLRHFISTTAKSDNYDHCQHDSEDIEEDREAMAAYSWLLKLEMMGDEECADKIGEMIGKFDFLNPNFGIQLFENMYLRVNRQTKETRMLYAEKIVTKLGIASLENENDSPTVKQQKFDARCSLSRMIDRLYDIDSILNNNEPRGILCLKGKLVTHR